MRRFMKKEDVGRPEFCECISHKILYNNCLGKNLKGFVYQCKVVDSESTLDCEHDIICIDKYSEIYCSRCYKKFDSIYDIPHLDLSQVKIRKGSLGTKKPKLTPNKGICCNSSFYDYEIKKGSYTEGGACHSWEVDSPYCMGRNDQKDIFRACYLNYAKKSKFVGGVLDREKPSISDSGNTINSLYRYKLGATPKFDFTECISRLAREFTGGMPIVETNTIYKCKQCHYFKQNPNLHCTSYCMVEPKKIIRKGDDIACRHGKSK